MTLPRLLIVGTGGFAKEVAQLAASINAAHPHWQAIGYVGQSEQDARLPLPFGSFVGTDEILRSLKQPTDVVLGMGTPTLREKIAMQLESLPFINFPNLIHPKSEIDLTTVRLGHGNIVTCGAVFTCDIVLGHHNVFNLHCTVGHDCRIGSYNVINPGANVSGRVSMGDACLLGTGSRILENLSITSGTILGANSLLTRDVTQAGTYIGTPARLK